MAAQRPRPRQFLDSIAGRLGDLHAVFVALPVLHFRANCSKYSWLTAQPCPEHPSEDQVALDGNLARASRITTLELRLLSIQTHPGWLRSGAT